MIPLRYAVRYGSHRRTNKIRVFLPPGGLAMLRALVSTFAHEGGDFLTDAYDLHEYDPSQPLAVIR